MSDWETPVQFGARYAVRHRPSGQTYYCPTYDDVQRLLTGSPPQKRSRVLAWWRGYRRSFLTLACWALLIFSVDLEARVVAPIMLRTSASVVHPGGGIKSQVDVHLSPSYSIEFPTITSSTSKGWVVTTAPNGIWWANCLNCSVWQDNLDKKLTWRDDPRWLPHAQYASAAAPKRRAKLVRRGR